MIDLVLESLKGMIVIWSGAIVDIPTGWHLCDGTEGTIDLRDKFVVGAGTTYNPADTGGAATHTHDFTGDGHSHTLTEWTPPANIARGTDFTLYAEDTNVTGTTDSESSLPPYYALAFIQKI